MPDIFLYSGEANPSDVKLRDPTVLAGGGATEALSGEATLALTATGDLTSVTALSGAATLALTATGALLSTTALSGAGSLAITATGALVSTTAMSGAASLILTATGNLAAVTGLSGAATLALAATGSLGSVTALSGSATLSLAATGDLSAATSFSGEASLTLEASGDLSVTEPVAVEPIQGGGWLSESQVRAYDAEKKKRRKEQDDIEETIRLAYQRLTGKLSAAPIINAAQGDPEKLAHSAEKLAAKLVTKSNNSARLRTRNAEIIADLLRQADAILDKQNLDEEEAIVMLLAA